VVLQSNTGVRKCRENGIGKKRYWEIETVSGNCGFSKSWEVGNVFS
jgi:hypothetical protein